MNTIICNSGKRSSGLYKFTAYINDNNILCLSCENSPDFSLYFIGEPFGQKKINQYLLQSINLSIKGRCGTEGGSQFIMILNENHCRIDCLDDLSFWIEFYI